MSQETEALPCDHCGGDVHIRNPSGYCDHLYYPDNCSVCKASRRPSSSAVEAVVEAARRPCSCARHSIGKKRTHNSGCHIFAALAALDAERGRRS